MCLPIIELDYEYDCNQPISILRDNEELQYFHFFSLVSEEGKINKLIILSNKIIFSHQEVLLKGFFELQHQRISRWYIIREDNFKNSQEPLCYGDKVIFYTDSTLNDCWTYPRSITKTKYVWQLAWNDGKIPPLVKSENNFIIKRKFEEVVQDPVEPITIYKKDKDWLIVGSVLICLVTILLIILIVLSVYIGKTLKNIKFN